MGARARNHGTVGDGLVPSRASENARRDAGDGAHGRRDSAAPTVVPARTFLSQLF